VSTPVGIPRVPVGAAAAAGEGVFAATLALLALMLVLHGKKA